MPTEGLPKLGWLSVGRESITVAVTSYLLLTSKVLNSASRSKVILFAIQSRARMASSCRPMMSMVSIESTTVYPIPPASVRLVPFRLMGWYSSSPIASRSVFMRGAFASSD